MSNSNVFTSTVTQLTTAESALLNAARTLLIKDGLLLDQPLCGKVTQKADLLNFSISVECGKDIIIINLPLTKGVPNATRVAIHSEMNGELVAIRTIRKSVSTTFKPLVDVYTNIVKVYDAHMVTVKRVELIAQAREELKALEDELAKGGHSDLVEKALGYAIKKAKLTVVMVTGCAQ